jgi:hypothetical protein
VQWGGKRVQKISITKKLFIKKCWAKIRIKEEAMNK